MTAMAQESYPMKGGDGTFSYTKNSSFQKEASSVVKGMIENAITEQLDIEGFLTPTTIPPGSAPTIRIVDLGCSVGPNTFTAVQGVIDTVESKHALWCTHLLRPQFQVFFNDHTGNDFNTLFTSLPPGRTYFSAGVPGSFYDRLFPDTSMHFVHSSYALQWLSKAPEELLEKGSPTWNGGRIHYTGAPREVVDAYTRQYMKDMGLFLERRAQELVVGGMMVMIVSSVPDDMAHSEVPAGIMFDLLGASLVDMVKDGLISEEKVDSFNLPIYSVSPKEMEELVAKNGRFSIKRMESTNPAPTAKAKGDLGDKNAIARHLRAGMEGIFAKHFGSEVMDELFDRFSNKTIEFSDRFKSCHIQGTQLFIVLVKQK